MNICKNTETLLQHTSNPDKAELLWCANSHHLHQLPTTALLIDGAVVDPAKYVRDPGIYIDSDLKVRMHVKRTVSRCFAALRQLRQIRRSEPPATFQSLVVTLVLSRLDYGNAVLIDLPAYLVRRKKMRKTFLRGLCGNFFFDFYFKMAHSGVLHFFG